ncbi:hypothetical protein [Streptomyces sp. B21-108]|uniref:hypothetical protein n=1 Tax=Streptomyces sp. B21-108 TaxID=3039419 RepID=UPI002FF133A5
MQPVSVLQTEYSLFEPDVEQLAPVLDGLGVGFGACSPLGRGFRQACRRIRRHRHARRRPLLVARQL